MNNNNNKNRILGKKRDELILTSTDLNFLNQLFKDTSTLPTNPAVKQLSISNASTKSRFLNIMNKISSLSLTQENLINIFEGLHLGNSDSIQDLFTNFNFKELIKDPKTFINSYEINNNNISQGNKNKFAKLSYIINKDPSKPIPKSKIGKSILIFFFILSQIVKYIKMKKAIFNGVLNRNIRTSSLNIDKATQAYNELKFLAKKFLRMREKIFELTQLQYAEENIPINTIVYTRTFKVNQTTGQSTMLGEPYGFHYFIYYHFFKNEIDSILLKHDKIKSIIIKYKDFVDISKEPKDPSNVKSLNIKFYSKRIVFNKIKIPKTSGTGTGNESLDLTFNKNPLNLKVCYKYLDSANYYNNHGVKQTNSTSPPLLDPFGFKPKPVAVPPGSASSSAVPVPDPDPLICDLNIISNINSILYLKKHKDESNEDVYEYNVITKRNESYFLYNLKGQMDGNDYKIIESKRPKLHFLDINKYKTDEYIDKYGSIILISYKG